ncbi:MAG: hypothetical protein L7U48_06285 [Candidatus Poseidoniaceae archaeon]|nr:hypothetical protein [Candidatus Poseidoniaceae archaeon]
MASGLSRLLEEESEHQWLAIGLFALFALAGGWAVSATGTISSLGNAPVTAAWQGHDVLDIAMLDAEWDLAHVGIVVDPQGPLLYLQENEGQAGVTLITRSNVPERLLDTEDGVWWDAGNGVLQGCYVDGGEVVFQQSLSGLDQGQAVDLVLAEDTTNVLGWLLVADGQSTSAVAYDGLGSNFTAVSAPEGVTWTHLEQFDERHLAAIGWRVAATPGQNPAQPEMQAWITVIQVQDGTMTKLQSVEGPLGSVHSTASFNDGTVLVATEENAVLIDSGASTTSLGVRSSAAMLADDGTVWFAGSGDSTLMPRWMDGTLDTERLASPLGLIVTSAESDGHRWVLFGTNGDGEHAAMVLDVDQNASPLSGRGFLNLMFLVVGTASILGIASTWWRQSTV